MRRLFHIAARAAPAEDGPGWVPPEPAGEGFVHLSFAEQLEGTLVAHFAGADALVLLEVDPLRTAPALRLERSRGGQRFPHLYRALERDDVLRTFPLERDAAGRFVLPPLEP